jgi:hypothetical protein
MCVCACLQRRMATSGSLAHELVEPIAALDVEITAVECLRAALVQQAAAGNPALTPAFFNPLLGDFQAFSARVALLSSKVCCSLGV